MLRFHLLPAMVLNTAWVNFLNFKLIEVYRLAFLSIIHVHQVTFRIFYAHIIAIGAAFLVEVRCGNISLAHNSLLFDLQDLLLLILCWGFILGRLVVSFDFLSQKLWLYFQLRVSLKTRFGISL